MVRSSARFLTLPILAAVIVGALPGVGCGSSSGGANTGGANNDIVIAAKDTYLFGSASPQTFDQTAALTPSASAAASGTSYPGTLANGQITIPNVPQGPYLLSLGGMKNVIFPGLPPFFDDYATSARALDNGNQFTVRSGLVPMTKTSNVTLKLGLAVPWQASVDANGNTGLPDDALSLFSLNTGMIGLIGSGNQTGTNGPTNGVSSIDWTVDMNQYLYGQSSFSNSTFDASKGDTLDILHLKTAPLNEPSLPAGDPWQGASSQTAVEAFHSSPFTLANGSSATLAGTSTKLTQKSFDIDFQGSAFAPLFNDLPQTLLAYSTLTLSVYMEPGTPNPGDGADATLLQVTAYPRPASYCVGISCDLANCANGCLDSTTYTYPGDLKHTFAYGDPFDYGQELLDVVYYFAYQAPAIPPNAAAKMAGNDASDYIAAYLERLMPLSAVADAPVTPQVGFPRNLKLNGAPIPMGAITPNIGTTPTLTFDAPALGTPSFYSVSVFQGDFFAGSGGAQSNLDKIAFIRLSGTSFTFPDGLLQTGGHYYLVVAATYQDGWDPTVLNHNGENYTSASSVTGFFTTGAEAPAVCSPGTCSLPAGPCNDHALATCDNGQCSATYTEAPADSQPYGTCTSNTCNTSGTIDVVPDNSNVQASANPCVMTGCTNGAPTSAPAAANTPCNYIDGHSGSGFCEPSPVTAVMVCSECVPGGSGCTGGNVCSAGKCVPTTCTDGTKDAGESDVDCGGPTCLPCATSKACLAPTDCSSRVCSSGTCAAPSCTDHVQNGTETDVDCGGSSCPGCADTGMCNVGKDCLDGVCQPVPMVMYVNVCSSPTCTDAVQNGDETGIDCGGSQCPACAK